MGKHAEDKLLGEGEPEAGEAIIFVRWGSSKDFKDAIEQLVMVGVATALKPILEGLDDIDGGEAVEAAGN